MYNTIELYKGVIFIAVSAEIRAVPRPDNTIVNDSSRDGSNRYSVRELASSKYVPGAIRSPETGR